MTDHIELAGLEVFAYHGVLESEQAEGQLFVIDLRLDIDLAPAGESDDLDHTVDYGRLASRVHALVSGERWDLIERVAERVAALALEDQRVAAATVTVHKPQAPIDVPFRDVSVTVRRSR